MNYTSYHDLLSEEFARRKSLDHAYSLRSYADDLGLNVSRLSQILNRKQGLSIDVAKNVASKLKLTDKHKQWFCHSVGALHSRSFRERAEHEAKIKEMEKDTKVFSNLDLEYFKVISDWYHFAILELTYLADFRYEIDWIANKLGITTDEAKWAINRMIILELLVEENGTIKDRFRLLSTPSDVPNNYIKKFHTQILKKAIEAVHERDVLEREFSSNVFAVDKSLLPELKERLREVRREFQKKATTESVKKDSVYCLSLQFFELTASADKDLK